MSWYWASRLFKPIMISVGNLWLTCSMRAAGRSGFPSGPARGLPSGLIWGEVLSGLPKRTLRGITGGGAAVERDANGASRDAQINTNEYRLFIVGPFLRMPS